MKQVNLHCSSQATARLKSDSKRRLNFYVFLKALQLIDSIEGVGQNRKMDWTLTVIDEWLAYAKRAGKMDRKKTLLPDFPLPLENIEEPSPVRQRNLYHRYNHFMLVKFAWGVYHNLESPGEPLLPPVRRSKSGVDLLKFVGAAKWLTDLWEPSR